MLSELETFCQRGWTIPSSESSSGATNEEFESLPAFAGEGVLLSAAWVLRNLAFFTSTGSDEPVWPNLAEVIHDVEHAKRPLAFLAVSFPAFAYGFYGWTDPDDGVGFEEWSGARYALAEFQGVASPETHGHVFIALKEAWGVPDDDTDFLREDVLALFREEEISRIAVANATTLIVGHACGDAEPSVYPEWLAREGIGLGAAVVSLWLHGGLKRYLSTLAP